MHGGGGSERPQDGRTGSSFTGHDQSQQECLRYATRRVSDALCLQNDCFSHLHAAAISGDEAKVARLLGACADPNLKSADGGNWSPLQLCSAYSGSARVASMLLDANARTDDMNAKGFTALCIAAARGHTRLVFILLEAGANPNPKQDDAKTKLVRTAKTANSIIKLPPKGSSGNRVIKNVIAKAAKAEAKRRTPVEPLYLACINRHSSAMQVLLDAGADPTFSCGKDSQTSIEVVEKMNSSDECQTVLRKFLDKQENNRSATPVISPGRGGSAD